MLKHFLTYVLLTGWISLQYFEAPAQQVTSLRDLLQLAETNYPLLKSKRTETDAAQKGKEVANNSFLPSLEASYQANYATHNNISGMSYPQFLLPISGPPSTGNTFSGVFGSAAALLFQWQPGSFGQRKAQESMAQASTNYAVTDADYTLFQHRVAVCQAYLNVLSANELTDVFQNNLQRTEATLRVMKTLAESGIRPGIDTTLLRTEVAKARIELLNAKYSLQQTRLQLTQLVAVDALPVLSDSLFFAKLPVATSQTTSEQHPLLKLNQAQIEVTASRKNVIASSTKPNLGIWGTTYARGSGVDAVGNIEVFNGLGLQRFNYGIGAQLNIPLLQGIRIRPQLQQQELLRQAQLEKLQAVQWQLRSENAQADAAFMSTLEVARESPLFLAAAQTSYQTLQSRYQAGLANFSDLVQVQYGLIKAETDLKVTYMNVWKMLLTKAVAQGDLNLFLNQVN